MFCRHAQTPAQYIGGEWNAVRKDHRTAAAASSAWPFPILLDRHEPPRAAGALRRDEPPRRLGLRAGVHAAWPTWSSCCASTACRFSAWRASRRLREFDVLGFTLQYDLCYSNVLTMLDLGGHSAGGRTSGRREHPLVIAGGPCAVNPEPMARFIDLFVIGDGEEALPEVCDLWLELKQSRGPTGTRCWPRWPPGCRMSMCPGSIEPQDDADGRAVGSTAATRRAASRSSRPWWPTWMRFRCRRRRSCRTSSASRTASPSRSCAAVPGKCRFCQSTTIKRPLRFRKVETIVQAALEQYRNTGYNEISLLSLSTSDYPRLRRADAAAARDVPPAGRGHLAAQPADQRAIAAGRRPAEHRPPLGPDAWPRRPPATTCGGRSASRSPTTTCMPAAAGRSRTVFRG